MDYSVARKTADLRESSGGQSRRTPKGQVPGHENPEANLSGTRTTGLIHS
jgi:hypothetical protein